MFAATALQEIKCYAINPTELIPISWNFKNCGLYSLLCGWLPVAGYPKMIGVSHSFVGPVEDPKLIHMVMIAQFWPTNHHPDDEGRVFTIYNLHFTFPHMMFLVYYKSSQITE